MRFRFGIALSALAGAALIGMAGVSMSGPASGTESPASTTIIPIAAGASPEVATPVASAVAATLGPRAVLLGDVEVRAGAASHDDFDFQVGAVHASVSLYHRFDEAELASLRRVDLPSGTMWIGAQDPDLTSIYFRSASTGVSVWLSEAVQAGSPPTPTTLRLIAVALASNPLVRAQVAS